MKENLGISNFKKERMVENSNNYDLKILFIGVFLLNEMNKFINLIK